MPNTMATLPLLFESLPTELEVDFDAQVPWSLLGAPLDQALSGLPSQGLAIAMPPDVHLIGDRIVIGKGTRILPGAIIEGPVRIGEDALIRGGAYIRGGCWIGDGCVVGASTEIKRAILLEGAKAPHLNYVGDSILGRNANLGAGTILSNFRHDAGEIRIPVEGSEPISTGRRKLGAILGDDCMTGCNSVLNPGTVVGQGSHLYSGVQLRSGIYPARSLIKLRQQLEIVERR